MKKIKTKFKMKVIRFLFWLWHGKEKNYSLPPKNVQTILFLRTDGIGDFVISTPLLRELRKTYPTAKISYLITNFIKELVDPCPYKDEVIVLKYKDPKDLLSFKWSHLLYFFWFSFWKLRKRKFDIAITTRSINYHYDNILMYLSGAKYRLGKVGFNKSLNETRVTMTLLTNIDPIGLDVHEVEFNLSSLNFFNRSTTNKKLEIWIPKKHQDNVYKLFKTFPKAPFYFSIMIGSSNILRKWSIINFAKLIHYCTEEYHAFCFILGGKEEEKKGCKLENLHPNHSLNLCGKLSLLESCEVIRKSNLYIGNDTGLMHIASATTTPIIEISAFFIDGFKEHTNSPKRYGPWMTPHKIVQPIEKISDIPMECVTFKMVKQALDELIEEVIKKNINQKESLF